MTWTCCCASTNCCSVNIALIALPLSTARGSGFSGETRSRDVRVMKRCVSGGIDESGFGGDGGGECVYAGVEVAGILKEVVEEYMLESRTGQEGHPDSCHGLLCQTYK